jgi:hypothetical protein
MLRVIVEHELHHLEYAKSTSGLRGFIHRIFPGLEEFIVSFRNVFRWFDAKLKIVGESLEECLLFGTCLKV